MSNQSEPRVTRWSDGDFGPDNFSAVQLLLGGLVLILLGLLFVGGDPIAWVLVGIGGAVLVGSVGLWLGESGRQPRSVVVDLDAKTVEIRNCRIATSFWKSPVVPHVSCPFQDVRCIELHGRSYSQRNPPILRMWMPRGYLTLTSHHPQLGAVYAAIHEAIGPKPIPLLSRWQTQLAIQTVIGVSVAVGVCLLLLRFVMKP